MEISITNLIGTVTKPNYTKSTFKVSDSQKVYDIVPEKLLEEISKLKTDIETARKTEVPKNIERLKQSGIAKMEHDLFIKKRNLIRLNNKYPNAKWL
jgi:hypothetical protein